MVPNSMNRRIAIPEAIWKPIAQRILASTNITLNQMLWGGAALCFCVPRARLWRELRDATADRPGYSLGQIGDITGHTTAGVLKSLDRQIDKMPLRPFDPAKVRKPATATGRAGARGLELTGQTFGTLTVIGRAPRPAHIQRLMTFWHCKCECGSESIKRGANLTQGNSTTCGDVVHRRKAKPRVRQDQRAGYEGDAGTGAIPDFHINPQIFRIAS